MSRTLTAVPAPPPARLRRLPSAGRRRLCIGRGVAELLMLALLVLALLAPPVAASLAADTPALPGQKIAAVVNDEIISLHDLDSRIALFIATTNLQDTPETRRRLAPDVLRTLIDEALKRQEIRRQNISVGQDELDRALTQVAVQLRLPPGALPDHLAERGIGMPTLIDQLEVEIGWYKLLNRLVGERARVSEAEIEEELERLRRNAGGTEYRVSEIFLAVEDPANQQNKEELAKRLVSEVRGGANFAALARTFSQGPSAEASGDLGWLQHDELDPRVEQVVSRLQPGEVSDPIRGQGGYFILYLAGRRAAGGGDSRVLVSVQQLFLPATPDTPAEPLAARVQDLTQGVTTCEQLQARHAEAGAPGSGTLRDVDLQQLPSEIRQILQRMSPGDITRPMRTADGMLVMMLCDRREVAAAEEQRATVERRLRDQRSAAIGRQELRELRRAALLDIRL